MKINLSPENKAALASLRAAVSEQLNEVIKSSGHLEAMKLEEAKRNDEIDKIERGIAFDDGKAVQSFTTRKEQLAILRRRIERLEEDEAPALDRLSLCLQGVHQVLAPALEPSYQENVVEAACVIHPYVGEWAISLKTAGSFLAMRHFASNFIQRRYGGPGDPIGQARQLLSHLDALLSRISSANRFGSIRNVPLP